MNKNGFTLLELIISMAILAVVLAAAAPSFHGLIARNKVERTVTEIKGLFIAAKSEAVMRNKEVYLHTIGLTDTKTYTDDWCVIATTDITITDCDHSNTLYKVDGSQLQSMNIQRHSRYAKIRIDKLNGHPDFSSSLIPVDWITFEKENGKALTMQMTWMGRLYQCGVDGEWYGIKRPLQLTAS